MTLRLFALFTYLLSIPCLGQNITISGSLKGDGNEPIAYANVVLLSVEDSSFISGTTTNDDGVFGIETTKMASALLKISFLGFETYSITINTDKNLDLGIITLKEKAQALEGITVIAKRPTVKRLVDRLVFNVENSTLSTNNVLDVLKHTPGVLVHDEKITIKNSIPTVYINDRKVHLSSDEVQQLLEGTSATNVKSIEVITNPPAKYEAEGGAVLNIVTSKNIIAGYNGSIFGNYKKGSEYPKYSIGTSHYFKTKKLNAYLNYSISPKKEYNRDNELMNFINDSQITSIWETEFKRTRESSNQNINSNVNYEINRKNIISFTTNMIFSPREKTKTFTNSFTEVYNSFGVLDSTFNTVNRLVSETFNLAFTLDYIYKFKKEGEKLSINAHHTNYDFSNFQNVDTDYLFTNNTLIRNNRFQTFTSQKIKLFTGQVDYELPIDDSSKFEAGGKISSINSESVLNQFSFNNGIKEEDLENSDTFLYDETNFAIYMSYSKHWSNWSVKSGLRVEHTDIKGNSLSSSQINNSDYKKIFPSINLLNRINKNNEVYLNYNKRIYRPRYNVLNPFRYFINDNAYITGDPNLKPQIDDILTLGYTFNKNYTFELYYRYESDPTIQIIFQDNDKKEITYRNTNIDKSISYGLDFTTYTEIASHWDLYVVSSLYFYKEQFFALESNNELLANDKWSIYTQIINYFSFLKDKSLTAELSLLYNSPYVSGPTDIDANGGVDVNFKKTLWNNQASLSIGVLDVFNSKNINTSTKYLNQNILVESRKENRLLTIGFSYKFGNFRLKSNEKKIHSAEERERLN